MRTVKLYPLKPNGMAAELNELILQPAAIRNPPQREGFLCSSVASGATRTYSLFGASFLAGAATGLIDFSVVPLFSMVTFSPAVIPASIVGSAFRV